MVHKLLLAVISNLTFKAIAHGWCMLKTKVFRTLRSADRASTIPPTTQQTSITKAKNCLTKNETNS